MKCKIEQVTESKKHLIKREFNLLEDSILEIKELIKEANQSIEQIQLKISYLESEIETRNKIARELDKIVVNENITDNYIQEVQGLDFVLKTGMEFTKDTDIIKILILNYDVELIKPYDVNNGFFGEEDDCSYEEYEKNNIGLKTISFKLFETYGFITKLKSATCYIQKLNDTVVEDYNYDFIKRYFTKENLIQQDNFFE